MVQVKSRQWRTRKFLLTSAFCCLPGFLVLLLLGQLRVPLDPKERRALSHTSFLVRRDSRAILGRLTFHKRPVAARASLSDFLRGRMFEGTESMLRHGLALGSHVQVIRGNREVGPTGGVVCSVCLLTLSSPSRGTST